MKKNVSGQRWVVFAYDLTDGTPKTGDAAQITAKISKDGGALTATNDTNPTELEDGFYEFDLTQAETNAYELFLSPESSTSDIQVVGSPATIFTTQFDSTSGYPQTDQAAISGDTTAADNLESACDNYSATRGLAGTALPDAAADAAGGLPISDAGGLDLDGRLDAAISSRLAPTVASRTLDVTATGAAGIDWANIENPSTAVDLSGTDIQTVDTATNTGTVTGNVDGSVGSVTGNVGGNVVGSVDSVTDPVTVGTNNDKSGYSLAADQSSVTVGTVTDVTNQVTADMAAISGDSTAADNLEAMFDGSGYVDDNAPSTQQQVSNIGSASGGAINFVAEEDNTGGAIDPSSAAFVGSVQGGTTYTNTHAIDGTVHDIDDVGDDIDIVYGFDIGAGRTATAARVVASVDGTGDEIAVRAYDHDGATWDTIGTITGGAGTPIRDFDLPLLLKHSAGTGSEIGKVYIRFDTLTTTPSNLSVDAVFVAAVASSISTVGYANAAIWVNTNASNTNTVPYIDGVADNPVSTWAAALSLSSSLGIKRFELIDGSSIQLTANSDYYDITGYGSTVDLNGQSVAGALITGAKLVGDDDGSNSPPLRCRNCTFQTHTLGQFRANQCPMTGTITLAEAGTYILEQCLCSCVGGVNTTFDNGAAVGDTTLSLRHWSGTVELENLGQSGTDRASVLGDGHVIVNANCVGGTLGIAGDFKFTDNSGGAVTISDDGRWGVDQKVVIADDAITADVFDESTAYPLTSADSGTTAVARTGADGDTLEDISDQIDDVPTNAELEARTIPTADYFDPSSDQVTVATNNDKTGYSISGTITTLDALDTALDDAHGAGSWETGTGSTAQEVWEYATRSLTDKAGYSLAADQSGVTIGTANAIGTDGITAASLAVSANEEIADYVWDEVLTGATHNITASAGRRLRESDPVSWSGQVVSATANTVTLDSTASGTDGSYDPSAIIINDEVQNIIEYFGTAGNGNPAKTAILARDWKTVPSPGDEAIIRTEDGRVSTNQGQLAGGSTTTAVLNSLASSVNGTYAGQILQGLSGPGQDQAPLILTYDGATKTATFEAVPTAFDATSGYQILPLGSVSMCCINLDTQSAVDLKDFADNGYDPAENKVEGVKLVDTTTENADMVAEAPTPTEIDTELTTNHGAGSWQTGSGGGGATGTLWTVRSYFDGTASNAYLEGSQNANINVQLVELKDQSDNPINLTGKDLSFAIWQEGVPGTELVVLKNYDGDTSITVSGVDGNTVAIFGGLSQMTMDPGDYLWRLRNDTDDTIVVRRNKFTVNESS